MAADAVFDPAAAGWELDPEGGFVELIGPIWIKRVDGALRFGLTVAEKHMNRDGSVHGGVYLAFFDHALGIFAHEAGDVERQVTAQMNTHFIGAAKVGQFMEIHPEVIKQTQSFVFMRGTCLVGDRMLAMTDGLWKKFRPRQKEAKPKHG